MLLVLRCAVLLMVGQAVWSSDCYKPVDVIVMLDGSGSVTQENWIKSLQFTRNLSENVLALNNRNKIGIIDYSQIAREYVYLTSDNKTIEEGINQLAGQYQNGITRTELALEEAKRMFKMESLDSDSRVLITITDGKTTPLDNVEGKYLIAQPASDLKVMGVHMIAIGVTEEANNEELNIMASSTADVLNMVDYDELLKKVGEITKIACSTTAEPTVKPTVTTPTPSTPPTTPSTTSPTQPITPPSIPTVITIAPTASPTPSSPAVCKAPYHKIGCFHDDLKDPRPLPSMLFTDTDPGSAVYSGQTVDWNNWENYLVDLVCRCSKAAEEKGYAFFSIQYYGQCWSGEKAGETYKRNGASSNCVNTKNQACSNDDQIQCAGQNSTNYVYGRDITPSDVKCSIPYENLGCFKDDRVLPRPLSDLILTDRDTTSPVYSGVELDWGNWDTYMPDLVCRCAKKAAEAGKYLYFGIQNYGECWAGGDTYNRNGEADTCITKGFVKCPANATQTNVPCVGNDGVNYIYGIKSKAPTCDVKYERVGCYNDNHETPRPLPELILTDRDSTSPVYSHQEINWGDWDTYMPDFVCRCARAAKNKRLMYIGLQFYGECWSGSEGAETYAIDGPSSNCITDGYNPCLSDSQECIGKQKTNSVYKVSLQ